MRAGETEVLHEEPAGGEAYRLEIGGGHWIFGGDPAILRFLRGCVKLETYQRKSGVYLPDEKLYVPYPLQNHLRYLGAQRAAQALREMCRPPGPFTTMKGWLEEHFGKSLSELFFDCFHALYTAGLYDRIAPQDGYKSPIDLGSVIAGAFGDVAAI